MAEVKVIDLLMCLNGKLYFHYFKVLYGSSITFLIIPSHNKVVEGI